MYSLHKNPIGIYEKALPNSFTWEGKFRAAKAYQFVTEKMQEAGMEVSRA